MVKAPRKRASPAKATDPVLLPKPNTIPTPWGPRAFRLDVAAMADVSSRLIGNEAYGIVRDMPADPNGRAHSVRLHLFIRAGLSEARGEPVDAETAHLVATDLGVERMREIILNHAPEADR